MKLLGAIFIAAIFLIGIGTTISRNTQNQNNSAGQLSNSTFTPKAGSPLTLGYLELSTPPILSPISSTCADTASQNQLSWNDIGAAPYVVLRDNSQLASVTTTTYTDVTAVAGKTHCYYVQGSQVSSSTAKTISNRQCILTKSCGALATGTGTGTGTGTQTPTPTTTTQTPIPTITATPTPKPSPTVTPIPAYCQTTTQTADGRFVVNAKAAGAKGDGVTNDRDAIQNALNCFKTNDKGGAIYIPAGTYLLSRRLVVYSNEIIFGDDTGSGNSLQSRTILKLNTTKDYLIFNDRALGRTNITIRDITLQGTGQDDLSPEGERCCSGIEFHNLEGGYILNVTTRDFNDNGIHFDRYITETKGVNNVVINGCKSINNKRSGIAINNGTANIINNCIVTGNNKGNNGSGWSTNKGDAALILEVGKAGSITRNKVISSTVSNNGVVSRNQGGGIALKRDRGTTDQFLSDNAVCKNTVEGNGDVGIAEINGSRDIYIANVIRNNLDRRDGKIVICDEDVPGKGCQSYGNNAFEDERSNATHQACDISSAINSLPPKPPLPPAVQGASTSLIDWLMQFFKL